MPKIVIRAAPAKELPERIAAWIAEMVHQELDEGQTDQDRNSAARTSSQVDSVLEVIEKLVDGITQQLSEAISKLQAEPPPDPVLCAFGSVLDHTCTLDAAGTTGTKQLPAWVAAHGETWKGPAGSEAVKKTVCNPDDIRRVIEFVFENADGKSAGGKSVVETKELREALLRGKPAFPYQRKSLGGAPAIISNVLSGLGVTAAFYSVYHPKVMEAFFSEKTRWLDANTSNLQPILARKGGRAWHPVRYGFALAYGKGKYRKHFFGGITAKQADRHLLVLKPSVKLAGARPWTSWSLDREPQGVDNLAPYEWPGANGFVWWRLEGGHLAMHPVERSVLTSLGTQYKKVVLSGPQLVDVSSKAQLDKQETLRAQLREVTAAGACLHLELSGEAEAGTLGYFADFLEGLIPSVGINSEELPGYAALARKDRKELAPENIDKLAPGERYAQALSLARALRVDRLYVHGNDYDILIRCDADSETVVKDATGVLFAKVVVLVATILRNPPSVTTDLKLPLQLNTQTVEALKRLGESAPQGVGIPSEGLGSGLNGAVNDHWKVRTLRGVVRAMVEPDGYRAAFIPCVWLSGPVKRFSSTGAGDITSGVSFVYSDYCKH